MATVVHWDDVPARRIDRGDLQGTRARLGVAAGTRRTGLSRYRLAAGERAMPVHVHADEEELFFVLDGDGISWQDGRGFAVTGGDLVVHRARAEAHTIIAAPGGPGLDVLAFGTGSDTGLTWLPRAGAWWAGPHWLPHDGPNPLQAEAQVGPLERPAVEAGTARPPTIVATGAVAPQNWGEGDVRRVGRDLGRAAGSVRGGVWHLTVEPGMLSAPPHCHSVEEEVYVVLDGAGVALLGEEEHAVHRGTVVACPPADGVAHALRAGDGGLVVLAFGTREPADACFYPRSGKVALRGLKTIFRVDRVDYWDGEL